MPRLYTPGGLQTGVYPSDLLADQPIQEMAPSVRRIRKALCAYLVATRHARVERIFGNVDTQYSVDHYPILPLLSLQQEPRIEQPCTQDLRSRASQDTVQSKQRSLEKRGLIYRTGSFAKGTQEAHRSPSLLSKMCIRRAICNVQGTCVSSHAPRTEPYVRLSRIRLVWGFPCQGCITPLFVVLLLHSFVRPAPRAFFRPDRILPSPSRAAMVKDGAFSAPPKACP